MKRALLAGERVYLRRPVQRDRTEFLERVTASRKLHRSWVHPPATHGAFSDYVGRSRGHTNAGYLVCVVEDDAIAGVYNVNEIVRGAFYSGYLGYYGFEQYAGQGYMSEGLKLVLRHVFTKLGLHRLEANIQPANVASTALVQRAGFRLEGFSPRYLKIAGRWRDHERWAITVEDWRELRRSRR
jgi:[ribosomal protein S5]-alanine N-acetyltransferase